MTAAEPTRITIEMLTERKLIDVVPGTFRHDPPRIFVDVCVKCGAVVFDVVQHDSWHRRGSGVVAAPSDHAAKVAAFAAQLGVDVLPWQRQVIEALFSAEALGSAETAPESDTGRVCGSGGLADLVEAEALDADFDAPGGDAYIHGLRRAVEIVRTGRRDR